MLYLRACKCSRQCKSPKCECISNGLKCTDVCACSLRAFDNQGKTTDTDSEVDDSNREYDDISDDD